MVGVVGVADPAMARSDRSSPLEHLDAGFDVGLSAPGHEAGAGGVVTLGRSRSKRERISSTPSRSAGSMAFSIASLHSSSVTSHLDFKLLNHLPPFPRSITCSMFWCLARFASLPRIPHERKSNVGPTPMLKTGRRGTKERQGLGRTLTLTARVTCAGNQDAPCCKVHRQEAVCHLDMQRGSALKCAAS